MKGYQHLNFKLTSLGFLLILAVACQNPSERREITTAMNGGKIEVDSSDVLENEVLSQTRQEELSPDDVLNLLKKGNDDFINDRLTIRNSSSRVRAASLNQFPKAVILSCLDSRVPVEDVFHRGIGDIFVARVAGNIVNEDIIGSMEFACKVSGAKLVLVLGHEHCGAIKSAIDQVQLGNITALLAKIQPAVAAADVPGDQANSKNEQYVHEVCEQNVHQGMDLIRKGSAILSDMERDNEIKIAGGVYDMDSGKVSFL